MNLTKQLPISLLQSLRSTTTKNVFLDEFSLFIFESEIFRQRRVSIHGNEKCRFKLLAAAESAKHALSRVQTTAVHVESVHDGLDLTYSLSRFYPLHHYYIIQPNKLLGYYVFYHWNLLPFETIIPYKKSISWKYRIIIYTLAKMLSFKYIHCSSENFKT